MSLSVFLSRDHSPTVLTPTLKHVDETTPLVSRLPSGHASSHKNAFHSFRCLWCRVLVAMVAIPSLLLASSAIPSLHSFNLFSTRHANFEPEARGVAPPRPLRDSEDFNSVLGPLISTNFADPGVFHYNGISYAFGTNNRKPPPDLIHVQVATSRNNRTWSLVTNHDAMPKVGSWQQGKGVWAPDVVRLSNGKFVLYYSDNLISAPQHHCVGAAISDSILGPFIPQDKPFICPNPRTLGGAIDPEGFFDESTGKRYVIYKVDGNSLGHGGVCSNDVSPIMPTPLMLQEVSNDDGFTLIGEPVKLLDRDGQDGPLIEAPSMHRSQDGIYFLFYSSNCFTTPMYDIAYATSTNIKGPFVRSARPLAITGDGPDLVGPGGMDVILDGTMVVFHGHMTMDNDRERRAQVMAAAKKAGKPFKDIHLPLVRGMYSGVLNFDKHEVSLEKAKSKTPDEEIVWPELSH